MQSSQEGRQGEPALTGVPAVWATWLTGTYARSAPARKPRKLSQPPRPGTVLVAAQHVTKRTNVPVAPCWTEQSAGARQPNCNRCPLSVARACGG